MIWHKLTGHWSTTPIPSPSLYRHKVRALSLCDQTLLAQAGQQVLLLWMTVTGNVPSPKGNLGWLESSLFRNWAGTALSRTKHKWPIHWTWGGKKGSMENKHKFEEKPLGDLWPHPFYTDRKTERDRCDTDFLRFAKTYDNFLIQVRVLNLATSYKSRNFRKKASHNSGGKKRRERVLDFFGSLPIERTLVRWALKSLKH